ANTAQSARQAIPVQSGRSLRRARPYTTRRAGSARISPVLWRFVGAVIDGLHIAALAGALGLPSEDTHGGGRRILVRERSSSPIPRRYCEWLRSSCSDRPSLRLSWCRADRPAQALVARNGAPQATLPSGQFRVASMN